MASRSVRSTFALFAAVGSVLVFACSDSTAPLISRIPGDYELTTVLDSFTYSYSCTSSVNGLICSDSTVSAGASRLYGTFTIGDTIKGDGRAFLFPVSNVVLHNADCALTTTQCSEATSPWSSASITVRRGSSAVFGQFLYLQPIYFNGTFGDDKIVGTISWATYVGCCVVRHYDGTFVATRRP